MADGIIAIPLAGQPLAGEAGFDDVRPLRTAMVPYLAGPENRLLPPAVRGVLEARAATHNSLVFYGPTGTGKSHLARGLAAVWRERFPNQTVAYTNATDFARELADAIETQAVVDLRGRYRGVSLLVFEDVGRLAEKAAAQVELIHTLDAVLQEGGQVVVTASAPPAELKDLMPGLQSRLVGGLVLPLLPPGPGARLAILRQLAALREIALSDSAAQLLADGLSGTAPELLGALLQLHVPAHADGMPIDAAAVRSYSRRTQRGPKTTSVRGCGPDSTLFFAQTRRLARSLAAAAGGRRARRRHVPRPHPYRRHASADRPLLRRPRPHDRHAQLPQDGGPLEDRPRNTAGGGAIAAAVTGQIVIFVNNSVDNSSPPRRAIVGRDGVVDSRPAAAEKSSSYRKAMDRRSTGAGQFFHQEGKGIAATLSVMGHAIRKSAASAIDTFAGHTNTVTVEIKR